MSRLEQILLLQLVSWEGVLAGAGLCPELPPGNTISEAEEGLQHPPGLHPSLRPLSWCHPSARAALGSPDLVDNDPPQQQWWLSPLTPARAASEPQPHILTKRGRKGAQHPKSPEKCLVWAPHLQKALQCKPHARGPLTGQLCWCLKRTRRGKHAGRCRRHDREKLRLRLSVVEETPQIGSTSALIQNIPVSQLVVSGRHLVLTASLFSEVCVKQLDAGTAPGLHWRRALQNDLHV